MSKNYKIVLASKSPRRSQLMREAGLEFEVKTKEIEEIFPDDLPQSEVAEYLAKLKAQAFVDNMQSDQLIITADTVVVWKDKILGKPKDAQDATTTLRMLSDQVHEVITGVSLLTQETQKTFSVISEVKFYELSDAVIEHYVKKYQPYDKAGSYAIQEWIGLVGLEYLKGSYTNVLGLPIARLLQELQGFNVNIL